MTFESDYKFLETCTRMFRLDDNAIAKTFGDITQRTASIANNSNLEQQRKDQYCANMISKIIQRTASINSKVDEVGQLQSYLVRYQ